MLLTVGTTKPRTKFQTLPSTQEKYNEEFTLPSGHDSCSLQSTEFNVTTKNFSSDNSTAYSKATSDGEGMLKHYLHIFG